MTDNNSSVSRLFEGWHSEDREIIGRINRLRDWMSQVDQIGIPHFGETSHALRILREALVQHFGHEQTLAGQLRASGTSSNESVQLPSDQAKILTELTDLIERLGQLEPPFESWRAAMSEVEHVVSAIERHERSEQRSVESLMSESNHSDRT